MTQSTEAAQINLALQTIVHIGKPTSECQRKFLIEERHCGQT